VPGVGPCACRMPKRLFNTRATTGGCPYEPFFAHYQTHMTTAVVVDYCRDKREWPAL